MPKKFKGENSKAAEARARKDSQKQEERERVEQAKDDALWHDDDKHVMKKQQRKDDKEKKRQEQTEKKQQIKQLYDDEMSQIKSKSTAAPSRLTRAQIDAGLETQKATRPSRPGDEDDGPPLEENINRLEMEGNEARTVEDAIAMLSTKDPELDKHPEKRMKAAFQQFESEHLTRLKNENPNLRLSQLKQMIKKDWLKSPDNPMNQMHSSYNVKR